MNQFERLNKWWSFDEGEDGHIVMFWKYTSILPFFGRDISGPAHACRSSKHTEDEDEAEADADEPTTKFEPDPSLVFYPATENDDEDVEDKPDNGVSSSSAVFRSIR